MNRDSLHTRSSKSIHLSTYRSTKMALRARNVSGALRNGPWTKLAQVMFLWYTFWERQTDHKSGFRGWIRWLTAIPLLKKQNCEYYVKNKGKLSGKVCHCNFYFLALPVLLVKRFSTRVPILKLPPLGTCSIDSSTAMVPASQLPPG